MINLLADEHDRLVAALWKFSRGKTEFAGIDYDKVTYIPVLAFGNPIYETSHNDSGFGHIYVKSLDEARLVFFDLPLHGEDL